MKSFINIDNISSLLLYIVIVLVFTVSEIQGLSSLIAVFSIVLFCFLLIKASITRKIILPNSLILPYLCFVAFAALSLFWTPPGETEFMTMTMLSSCLFTVVTVWMGMRSIKTISTLKYAFSTILLVNVASIIVESISGSPGRLTGIANNANTAGIVISIAMFFCVLLIDKIWVKYVFVTLGVFATLFTGSRKMVFVLAGLSIILVTQTYRYFMHSRRKILIILAAGIVSLCILMMNYELISTRLDTSEQANRVFSVFEGTKDESAEIRLSMIENGVQLWQEKPVIGNGLGSFSELGGFGTYSHNNYVELLACLGIGGFVLYYLFDFLIIARLLPQAIHGSETHQFLLVIMFVLILYDFAMVSYYSRTIMLTKVMVVEIGEQEIRNLQSTDS